MNSDWHIVPLRSRPDLCAKAAQWFHEKWKIPLALYEESIAACRAHPDGIPQWYLVLDSASHIIAGLGAIENDFHKRTDLTPNVCAVYVEPEFRMQGVARFMLNFVCEDLAALGWREVYLSTGHTCFYEKCGWTFFCMAEEDDGGLTRMYRHAIPPQ